MKRLKHAWQRLGTGRSGESAGQAARVSFIVPAYNAEDTLHETLTAIQNQTFRFWEGVIVDDGSTDATLSIVRAAAQAEPRFRVVSQPNGGASAARNTGISHAESEWLVFLDADDWIAPNYLEAMMGALEAAPDLDAVVCKWVMVHQDGRHGPASPVRDLDQLFPQAVGGCPFAIHACVVRKRTVVDAGGFNQDLRTCEEWHLWQKIARTGAKFGAVDEVLAFYRKQSLDTLSRNSDQVLADALTVIHLGLAEVNRLDVTDKRFAEHLASSKQFVLIYWGTALICKGRSAEVLWTHIDQGLEFRRAPIAIARTIILAMVFSFDTFEESALQLWPQVRSRILEFLGKLEAVTGAPRLAARVTRKLAHELIMARPSTAPCVVEGLYGVSVEALANIADVTLPDPAPDAVVVAVTVAGKPVGSLWLPASASRLPAEDVKDAIARRFAREIFGEVVEKLPPTLVPHKRRGDPSVLFDVLLGGKADPAEQRRIVTYDGATPLAIELTEALPEVVVEIGEEIEVIASLGGVAVGRCRIPAGGGHVAPETLRRAIRTLAGGDLTRMCLRAAVVGQGITGVDEMRQRLRRQGEASFRAGSPDRVLSSDAVAERLLTESRGPGGSSVGRGLFEGMFARASDPWKYTSPYEMTKYEQTLSLLPPGPIRSALEIACAEGHFTEMLAPRVDKLIAADISQIALERAADRCSNLENVSYEHLDLQKDELGRDFDLIVCSEVLYFLGDRQGLTAAAGKIADALVCGGYLIMAHANLIADEPDKPGFDWPHHAYGARTISDVFSAEPHLQPVKEIRTPLYRVQAFKKVAQRSMPPPEVEAMVFAHQPAPVPDSVAATVRWHGGYPVKTFSDASGWAQSIPILAYHRIAAPEPGPLGRYSVDPDAFARQIEFLHDAGFYPVSWDTLQAHLHYGLPLPGRPIVLTFDDGYKDFKDFAFPVLQKYGFTATVFVCPAHVGKCNSWDGGAVPLLDWSDIEELAARGVRFGAHSLTHVPLTGLTTAEARAELAASKQAFADHLGWDVSLMAYPHGEFDPLIEHLAEAAGYSICLTTQDRHCRFSDRPTALPRVDVHRDMSFDQFVVAAVGGLDRSAAPVQKLCAFLEAINRPDRAIETARRWAELCRNQGDFQFQLAQVLDRQGGRGEALDAYRRAVQLEPGRPEYAFHLSRACARQGLHDEALEVVQTALQRVADPSLLLQQQGVLLLRTGRVAEAESLLRKAVGLNPNLPRAHEQLIVVCERQDRLDEALALAESSAAQFPGNAAISNRLMTLRKQRKVVDH